MKLTLVRFSLLFGLLFFFGTAMAQFTASGTVTDSNNEPLIGASVLVKGTLSGTVTDFNGNFSLRVEDSEGILFISYTGFTSEEVTVSSSNYTVNVTLSEDVANLEEIVVTGLASGIKRSNLANAVSTVSSEQLTGVTTQQTVDGALYGKLTGVNIVQSSGAPGGGIALRLRGISSLTGNNQPLFIIDGVYISNAEIPSGSRFASGANSGTEEGASNRIADINPEDIESIEVLKGASAAAIYGTRANAGVVIITTKKGKAGKTKVSLEQDLGFNTILNKVGRRQYTAAEVEEAFGADERAKFEAAQAAGQVFDYEDEIYGEMGLITDTRLSLSGGTDKTQFYINGSNRDEDGIIKNTGFKRRSLRLNLNHKITDKLKISTSTNYVNSQAARSFTGNENEGGLSYGYNLAFTRDWNNLFPNEDGVYPLNPTASGNPIFVRDQARNDETNNRLIQGLNADWTILQSDNLVFKVVGNAGADFFLNETSVYVPETHQAQVGQDNGFVGEGRNKFFNLNYQAFGVLDAYTKGGLNLNTQVGVSYLNFDRDFIFNQTTQLIPLQANLSQGGAQLIDQTVENDEEFGIILQEQANWDDKIIGALGVRFDKSSLNGDPNQFYAFPKASLAINIANFDFFSSNFFNSLKLRGAYGETGNSADFGSLFTLLNVTSVGGNAGFTNSTAQGRADLEPETSAELEFGVDVSMLNNRIGLEVSYYNREVRDLLYQRALPSSSGFSNEIRNDFDLVNQGVEVALNLNPVRSENLNWNSTFNFWLNRSEVTRLGVPGFVPPGVAFGLGLGTFFIEEGATITSLWNSGPEGPVVNGDVEPDFQLSWFNEMKIANALDFTFLWHLKQGGDVLNLSRLLTNIGGQTPAEFDDLEGFIEDASYLRLREVGLYYTVPQINNFAGRLRLGLSGRNLLTFTDYSSYDPETSTKGGTGLSTGIEVTPFPSSRQAYFHIALDF
ncbi:MAG: SusC/RagA family TonB-linked outer membrane protein [Bacteroidota bacterium]